jgi:hypothetical protein
MKPQMTFNPKHEYNYNNIHFPSLIFQLQLINWMD